MTTAGPGSPGGAPAPAAGGSPAVTVRVVGVGQSTIVPDALRVELGVEATSRAVAEALGIARAAMAEIRRVVSAAGVAGADQRTTGLNVHASHGRTGVQNGFVATASLTVLLRQPDLVDIVLTGAADAAGDLLRIGGLGFTVTDAGAAQDEARRAALAEARRRAELYATELGRSLGQLVRLVEGGPGHDQAGVAELSMRDSAAFEPGTQVVTIQVSAEWVLEGPRRALQSERESAAVSSSEPAADPAPPSDH